MVALNIFDPIVIIVLIYTVLITLVGLFNSPYPSSFLVLLTLFVITSYIYYKVNKNQPILIPVCEIISTDETIIPQTPPPTTMLLDTTTPPPPTTMLLETTPPLTMLVETTTTLPPTLGPITTLPIV